MQEKQILNRISKAEQRIVDLYRKLLSPTPVPVPVPSYKVFTAVTVQSSVNPDTNATSGLLIFGVSYLIDVYNAGDDFSNVGGPASGLQGEWDGYSFLATGTTPTNWNNSSLLTSVGKAPRLLTILENTIGINPVFTYIDTGVYYMDFYDLFPITEGYYKTAIFYTGRVDNGVVPSVIINQGLPDTSQFRISSRISVSIGPYTAGQEADNVFFGTLEIRVYN